MVKNRPLFILSAETSSPQGSVSLGCLEYGKSKPIVIDSETWQKERSHSEVITEKTAALLKRHELNFKDIDTYAVGVGPGSFTGVRVSINFIRTLAFGHQKPLYSFNSLMVLAAKTANKNKPILCLVNAYKNLIYCGSYDFSKGTPHEIIPPKALSAKKVEELFVGEYICVGDGLNVFSSQFSSDFLRRITNSKNDSLYPHASSLIDLSLGFKGFGQTIGWESLQPLYIRSSEAEEKLRSGLLKPVPKI